MEWIAFLLVVALWWRNSAKFSKLEKQLNNLQHELRLKDNLVQQLTRRVYEVESRTPAPIVERPPEPAVVAPVVVEAPPSPEPANKAIDLRLLRRYDNNRSNLLRRSDQWPFLQRGVPSLFIHTGLHPDYHTQFDRPEKIDYAKMERIVRFVYQLSWDTANAPTRPRYLERRQIPEPEQ